MRRLISGTMAVLHPHEINPSWCIDASCRLYATPVTDTERVMESSELRSKCDCCCRLPLLWLTYTTSFRLESSAFTFCCILPDERTMLVLVSLERTRTLIPQQNLKA